MSIASVDSAIWGKNKTKEGVAPAVALCNPKYPHNIGAALRACSCFGIKQLWFSGNCVPLKADKAKGYGTSLDKAIQTSQ